MARMVPDLDELQLDALKSKAEADFYRACRDRLDDRVLVIHSLALVRLTAAGSREDAEADFVIIEPSNLIAKPPPFATVRRSAPTA